MRDGGCHGLKSIVTMLNEKCSFCFRDSELSKVLILKDSGDNIIEIFDLKWVYNESNTGTLCKRTEANITTTF